MRSKVKLWTGLLTFCALCCVFSMLLWPEAAGQKSIPQSRVLGDRDTGGTASPARAYDVIGVGSRNLDQRSSLQSVIDRAPDGGEISCAPGTKVFTSQLNITQRSGLRFTAAGNGFVGGSCDVYYVGPDNGTLLNLDSSYDVSFDGWSFHGHNDYERKTGAAIVVDINKRTSGAAGRGINSSHHTFRNGLIETGTIKANAIGVLIGNDRYGDNSEFMHFENVMFSGWRVGSRYPGMTYYGTGVKLVHANVKGITFERSAINALDKFIDATQGTYKARYMRGGEVNIVYFGSGGEKAIIEGDNFETVCQVAVIPPGRGGDFRFSGGRYQAVTQNDTACGTPAKPLFEWRASGVLELDYPVTDAGTVAVSEDGQGALILHGGYAASGADSFRTFRTFSWFTQDQGMVTGGSGASTFSGSETGYHFSEANGSFVRGWFLKGANPWLPCNTNDVCFNDGQFELAGAVSANGFKAILTGTAGTQGLVLRLYGKDATGNRTVSSPEVNISNAPQTLNADNYVTINLSATPPGVRTFDIVHRCNNGTLALIASGVTLPYRIVANPACPGKYAAPTYNETAALIVRSPQGLNLFNSTAVKCFSDGGQAVSPCQVAVGVATPKLSGITDSAIVKNLNSEKWAGKIAQDFAENLDFGSVANQSCAERTVQVAGANVADAIATAWPSTLEAGVLGTMFVSSQGIVKIRVCNLSGSAHTVRGSFSGRLMR